MFWLSCNIRKFRHNQYNSITFHPPESTPPVLSVLHASLSRLIRTEAEQFASFVVLGNQNFNFLPFCITEIKKMKNDYFRIKMIICVYVHVWLWRVSTVARRLSPVAVTGGSSVLRGTGFSLQRSLSCQHRGFSSCSLRA